MVFRVHIRVPELLRRKARAYMRSIANPERCPRCQSRDTWKWTRNHGLIASVAKSFGRQLLTCRSCGNLFYTRAGNSLPPLAKALVGIGFEPEPSVRIKRRALPPALPVQPRQLATAREPMGGVASGAEQQAGASQQAAEPAFTRSAPDTLQGPGQQVVDAADQPSGNGAVATLTSIASEFTEPEPVKAARKFSQNIRSWQDHAWDVRDWEGNPLGSQPGTLSSDSRKAS